jgi:hypothetical protein
MLAWDGSRTLQVCSRPCVIAWLRAGPIRRVLAGSGRFARYPSSDTEKKVQMKDTLSVLDETRAAFEDFKKKFNKECPKGGLRGSSASDRCQT